MKRFIALLLFIPAIVFADEQDTQNDLAFYNPSQNNACCYQNDCCYQNNCGTKSGFNNNCLCFPWEIFITADFIYWKPFEGGLEYAVQYNPVITTGLVDAESAFLDGNWKPGFRVGLGVYNCNCPLDISAYYTRLNFKESTSVGGGVYPTLLYQGETTTFTTLVTQAEASWRLHYNTLDVDVGFYACQNSWLVIHPYLGIKTVWIDQKFDVAYAGGAVIPAGQAFSVDLKNDFWGIGPKVGFEIDWFTWRCLYVFGNTSLSVLWGQFNNNHSQAQGIAFPNIIDLDSKFDALVPNLQVVLGLGYIQDLCICSWRFNLGLRIAAEAQYYWAESQMVRFVDSLSQTHIVPQADLGLVGLTISGRIGF